MYVCNESTLHIDDMNTSAHMKELEVEVICNLKAHAIHTCTVFCVLKS